MMKKISRFDNVVWSFSRLNTYDECPRAFYLQYVNKNDKINNAFAEWGSLCHKIFEQYYKGELELYELVDIYKAQYDSAVQCQFPLSKFTDMASKYYERGVEVFEQYTGLPENLEVISSEKYFRHRISEEVEIQGYIDLIIRDKDDGKLIVQDFKSKSAFKSKNELDHYALQLYLYANHIFDAFGEYPKLLRFDMFKSGKTIDIPFDKSGLENANSWARDVVNRISDDKRFEVKKCMDELNPDFYCKYICGVRNTCAGFD